MVALYVDRVHIHGAARAALAVLYRCHNDGDRLARHCLVEAFDAMARDAARRQMEQDIDNARQPEAFERLGQRRSDAFENGNLSEQRVEQVGAHG